MFNFDSYIDAMNTQIKNVFKQDYNDELNNYIIETVRSYVNWAYEAYKIR